MSTTEYPVDRAFGYIHFLARAHAYAFVGVGGHGYAPLYQHDARFAGMVAADAEGGAEYRHIESVARHDKRTVGILGYLQIHLARGPYAARVAVKP